MNKVRWCCFLSILFIVAFVSNAQSQIEVLGTQSMVEKLRLEKGIKGIQETTYSDIEGDPYLFRDFHDGSVKMKNGEEYNAPLRYDIYSGEIHFKAKDQVYALINLEELESVKIKDTKFVYTSYKMSEGTENSKETYFEVLQEGNYMLLAKKNIRIQDAEPAKLYVEAKPAKFIVLEDSFFIKTKNEPAVRIKSKKDLDLYFEDKSDGVIDFTKKQKLKVNKSEDLIQIVKFANQ